MRNIKRLTALALSGLLSLSLLAHVDHANVLYQIPAEENEQRHGRGL